MEVSVIVPTYNRASTIRRSVDSVLNQDFGDFELLVIDDGSVDDTIEILSSIKDSRLRVISTGARSGATAARNLGISNSIGRLVAFQDSDDFWLPDKLSKQLVALADEPDAGAVYCKLLQVYDRFVDLVPSSDIFPTSGYILESLMKKSFISTQTLVVKRSLLDSVGHFDSDLQRLQDWDLVIRLAKSGVKFAFVPEALAIAYETPGNLTSFPLKAVDARLSIFRKHEDLMLADRSPFVRNLLVISSIYRDNGRAAEALKLIMQVGLIERRPFAMLLRICYTVLVSFGLRRHTRW